jgi:long-chain acyl-CoA synthetase
MINNFTLKKPHTIKSMIEQSVEKYPDKPALGYYDKTPITYGELLNRIGVISNLLKEKGLVKGDKVAILGENSPNWGIAYLSAVFLGIIAVPILPDFPGDDIITIIRHSEAKLLFATKKQIDKISLEDCKNIKAIITLDDFHEENELYEIKPINKFIEEAKVKATNIFQELKEKTGLFSLEVKEDDIAAIIYTSGTTGSSKGVMLTNKNIISNIISTRYFVHLDDNDRFLSVLPMSHAYEATLGFLMALASGSAVYYTGKPPTVNILRKACATVKPTIMAWVPLLMEKIYKKRVQTLFEKNIITKSITKTPFIKKILYKKAVKKIIEFLGRELKIVAFGGAPLNADVEAFMKIGGFSYVIGYGMTEASPLITGEKPTETKPGSCGYAIPEVEVKIVDPDPKTGIGDIWTRGPNVMVGYYKNKKITEETLTEDGWLKTGDRGYFDKDNYLYIKGRSKNMFLASNGENIYPENIEEKLNSILIVQESLVIENKGDIEALIYLSPELLEPKLENKSEQEQERIINDILEEIRTETNTKLPRFSKIKRCYYQREEFVKTATKKIKRYLYYHTQNKN